jgi:hypothetical protein
LAVVVVGFASTLSLPALAHHGNAGYDYTKTITVKGTVTAWIWANPHCLLKFDAKEDDGTVAHWVVEASNPPDMLHAGWAAQTFKPGDEVTVDVMPTKNGTHVGRIRRVIMADGKVLGGGGGGGSGRCAPGIKACL